MITVFNKTVSSDTRYLGLHGVIIKNDEELEKLTKLKKLYHLNLAGSNLDNHFLKIICKLASIELIDLDCTDITDKGLTELNNLINLKQLRLKDNPQITDCGLLKLKKLMNLELIHLGNTSITIVGLKHLVDFNNIQTIILWPPNESFFPEEQLINISKIKPSCEFVFKSYGSLCGGIWQK
jgi:hypothetical protein